LTGVTKTGRFNVSLVSVTRLLGEFPYMPEPTKDAIEVEGKIVAVLPGTMFRVELPNGGHQVLAHISGKLRKNFIKITVGDMVKMEMSPYDLNKARITYRLRNALPPRPGGNRHFGHRRH
jgi:translation initiation factor IF-1